LIVVFTLVAVVTCVTDHVDTRNPLEWMEKRPVTLKAAGTILMARMQVKPAISVLDV